MKLLDLTLATPELNLACDEALLDGCERGEVGETLRFWESDRPFVVLGLGNRVASEVDVPTCRSLGVPILRRCSGGGTVLQAPGCLNYALILHLDRADQLRSVTQTNRFIMGRHRETLASLLVEPVVVQGVTDLTLQGRKISGNAQRRQRRCLLFHGTFLFELDFDLLEKVLPQPTRQPAYRANRPHRDFLRTIPVSPGRLKDALIRSWDAHQALESPPLIRMHELAREKYSTSAWTSRS
jgi:lipoate---protein ligase